MAIFSLQMLQFMLEDWMKKLVKHFCGNYFFKQDQWVSVSIFLSIRLLISLHTHTQTPRIVNNSRPSAEKGYNNYRIYPHVGRTFLTKKHLESLQCGLYAGTRVRSSLICKVPNTIINKLPQLFKILFNALYELTLN